MDRREKLESVKSLFNGYTFGILQDLSQRDLRYTELETSAPNERTRSLKLKDLIKAKLISKNVIRKGNEVTIIYKITDKGRNFLKELDGFLKNI